MTVTEVIDQFQARHDWWSRREAIEVLRATRAACRDADQFAYITSLEPFKADLLWQSGRGSGKS